MSFSDVRRPVGVWITASLALFLSGCGTIFGGSSQEISLTADPSNSRVQIDKVQRTVTTPTEIELKRKNSYRVTFNKEGYSSETRVVESNLRAGILVLDILFTGLVGVAIDAGTGAWNSLSPENLSATLEQQTASLPGPDRIDVHMRVTDNGKAAAANIRSEESVDVRVEVIE